MPAHLTFVAGAADGAAANEGLSVMGWILCSGLRFGRLVIALAIGLLVIGIAQLRSAPVDVYPEFIRRPSRFRRRRSACRRPRDNGERGGHGAPISALRI